MAHALPSSAPFHPPGRAADGGMLVPQVSEVLAGSSLTLITFSSSALQLADVAANFCHILNLYITFLARVHLVCELLQHPHPGARRSWK